MHAVYIAKLNFWIILSLVMYNTFTDILSLKEMFVSDCNPVQLISNRFKMSLMLPMCNVEIRGVTPSSEFLEYCITVSPDDSQK